MMKPLKLSQTKTRCQPRYPNYNTYYYHKHVAPIECDICSCIVVTRAMYKHKQSANCELFKHFLKISHLEYDE